MRKVSIRHTAAIEPTRSGIGVSTTARMYIRQYAPNSAHMRNEELNEMIVSEFSRGEPIHRFKLRDGSLAEIRKSTNFYYVAKIRGRGTAEAGYDILVIQPTYKTAPEELRKRRLEPGWGAE